MKKMTLVVLSIALLFAAGCASKEYVKTQVDPLSERIGRIESRLNADEAKLNQVAKDGEADRAAIADAKAMAGKAQEDAARAAGDANKAMEAARLAEEAAGAAVKSAAMAEKAFYLQQKK